MVKSEIVRVCGGATVVRWLLRDGAGTESDEVMVMMLCGSET